MLKSFARNGHPLFRRRASAPTTGRSSGGLTAGVAADDPALPDTWGPDQNIVWKLDVPGYAWSSPVVWGRPHLHHERDQHEGRSAAQRSPVISGHDRSAAGEWPAATSRHQPTPFGGWSTTSISRPGRSAGNDRCRWRAPHRRAIRRTAHASETPATDGERVYAQLHKRRTLRVRLERQAGLVQTNGHAQDADRLGRSGCVSQLSTTAASTS